MHAALKGAVGYIPFLKGLADERGGDREVSERALRQALGTVAGIEDSLRREYVLQEAAAAFGLQADLLRETVAAMAAGQQRRNRFVNRNPDAGPLGSPDGTDREQDESAPGPAEATAKQKRRTGPQVRRSLAKVNAEPIEADMLSHVLMDDSGEAARVFVTERGERQLHSPEARILAEEITAWVKGEGTAGTVKDYVLERWNFSGDKNYRGYVNSLISKEDYPDSTDYIKVIKDCLERLGQDSRSSAALRGSVHTGE
jgi:DNA primase